jgi:hypothetical protein
MKIDRMDTIMNDLNPSQKLAVRPRVGRFSACRGVASARSRILILLAGLLAMIVTQAADMAATNTPSAIPWNQIGAKAGANYQGDGLAVTPAGSGARLHCVFQRLDGEATSEGLWLTSTVTNTVSDRFRVRAMKVGRIAPNATFDFQYPESSIPLADAGEVTVCGQTVRLSRAGLTEEYSVSMDGVRQDFIVEQAPLSPPVGELVVKLAVSGAKVEAAADGARLVLDHSGRKIAYSRLRVTDATGKELPSRIEVEPNFALCTPDSSLAMAVVVNDAEAVYPVRIDPTFSDANWVSLGGLPGANETVTAAVTDGSGNLYIGGDFTGVGNARANNVAKWNGSSWSALGSGMGGIEFNVNALAVSGGTLYAGGYFTTAGGITATNIAQWNGTNWSALGSGISGVGSDGGLIVFALAVSGGTLCVGGDFTTAGGVVATNIARWDGSSWSALGSGLSGGDFNGTYVNALAVSGSRLYAGGDFTTAGGNAVNFIAYWNGSSWSALGSGMNNPVKALAVSGGGLYAGGQFTMAGGISANYIAYWNGSSWSALGSGMSLPVEALAVSGSTLYAGGYFQSAGGLSANFIAQWNGTGWSALGPGISGRGVYTPVMALAVSGGTLYAGGNFTLAGTNSANYIAQWNGSGWSALSSGMNGFNSQVYALAASGSTLYAGGDFTAAGSDANANYVAQWNGSGWSALGSGMNSDVYSLAVSGSTVYAGGDFTTAGDDTNASYIAQWNGSGWSALGSGMNSPVEALAVSGGTLYAGGDFTTAGSDTNANSIAQWNGSSWSTLGPGMGGGSRHTEVDALAVSGGTLYAGGDFTTAGDDTNASYIAQWNGSSWSALGSGMDGPVEALTVSGGTLYAGGYFGTAGGSAANSIARWNGSSWSALGSGMNFDVLALAVSGGTLYASGDFTTAGGNAANYIAQWDGSGWSALGSGMNRSVSALAVSGGTLYAGGYFTTAGTNVSAYAAMAYLPGSFAITTGAAFGFTNGVFGFNVTGPAGSNVVVQASTDLKTWIPLQTNLLGGGPLYFSDPQSTTNIQRFYRVQLSP